METLKRRMRSSVVTSLSRLLLFVLFVMGQKPCFLPSDDDGHGTTPLC